MDFKLVTDHEDPILAEPNTSYVIRCGWYVDFILPENPPLGAKIEIHGDPIYGGFNVYISCKLDGFSYRFRSKDVGTSIAFVVITSPTDDKWFVLSSVGEFKYKRIK